MISTEFYHSVRFRIDSRLFFQLRCCGVDGPSDWARSVYNGYSSHEPREIGIPQNSNTATFYGISQFKIPQSCCLDQKSPDCLAAISKVKLKKCKNNELHWQGAAGATHTPQRQCPPPT